MKTRHFAQLIALSALWGASFPLLRIASPALGPWVVAGGRCILAAIVLALLMFALRERWPARPTWPRLAVVSLLTVVIPFVLFNWAALAIPSGYSAVLNATSPLFGVLAAAAVKEEKLTGLRLFGCLLGFVGVALLVQLGPVTVTPLVVMAALACVAAAASYGFGAILMKRATRTHEPLPASATVHVAAALILLVPAGAGAAAPSAHFTVPAMLAVLMIGTVTSGFMYWMSMRLMREISASAATSAAFMIPLFGVTWGAIFLGEKITLSMLPGCILVLAAMTLITGFNPFRGAPPEP
ncbi:MAG: DMT family transporter [Polaromonas sp.]|uniref:DMT family transporter n=1 Tax=Polaromonas sp. TaxID=1869339 RepID=UPI0025EDD7A8|nr:DMT family transporter [Polaromonas sp.]MBI2726745.1 DMT family transporter [Polaromonas sp.]